jgi:hypothetical protein
MKLGKGLPIREVKALPALTALGIALPYSAGKPFPHFERNRLSRAEENRKILMVLPPDRSSIPRYPPERSRLLAVAG